MVEHQSSDEVQYRTATSNTIQKSNFSQRRLHWLLGVKYSKLRTVKVETASGKLAVKVTECDKNNLCPCNTYFHKQSPRPQLILSLIRLTLCRAATVTRRWWVNQKIQTHSKKIRGHCLTTINFAGDPLLPQGDRQDKGSDLKIFTVVDVNTASLWLCE